MGIKEAKKVMNDFFKETTIHGLGQVRLAKKRKACVWLLFVATAVLICATQLSYILTEMKKREVIVNIKVSR